MRDMKIALAFTATNHASRAINDLNKHIRAIERETNSVSRATSRMSGDIDRNIRKAEGSFSRLASKASSIASTISSVGKGMASVGAGVVAGGMVLQQPVKKAMSYENRLAHISNTAFAERDTAGRIAAIGEIDQIIRNAVQAGGGTRESAADTYDSLVASGAMSNQQAAELLPTLQKYASATGADTKELGDIAIRAMQTFGVSVDQIPNVLDRAIQAGQDGGFELSDMAKWLPQQMAAARNVGMSGLDDFSTLLAANQASAITSGTKDEAGNNLVNLLAKISSADARKAAEKIQIDGKGIDLPGSLAAAKENGVNQLDAFVGIVDKIVAANPEYQKLQTRMAGEDDAGKKATMESMADIFQGSAIGDLIADRQALMSLVALMNNKEYVDKIKENQKTADGAGQRNFDVISQTSAYKMEQGKNAWDSAQYDAVGGLSGALGDVVVKLTEYASKYPALAATIAGVTTALAALAAAAGAAGVVGMITNRKRGGHGGRGGHVPDVPAQHHNSGSSRQSGGGAFAGLGVEPANSAGDNQARRRGGNRGWFGRAFDIAATAATTTAAVALPGGSGGTADKVGLAAEVGAGAADLMKGAKAIKAGGALSAVASVANLASIATDDEMSDRDKFIGSFGAVGSGIGGWLGWGAGGALAGAAGSVVPGAGTAAGAVAGSLAGSYAGGAAGGWLGEGLGALTYDYAMPAINGLVDAVTSFDPSSLNPFSGLFGGDDKPGPDNSAGNQQTNTEMISLLVEIAGSIAQLQSMPINVTSNLTLDGRTLATAVNSVNSRESRRE